MNCFKKMKYLFVLILGVFYVTIGNGQDVVELKEKLNKELSQSDRHQVIAEICDFYYLRDRNKDSLNHFASLIISDAHQVNKDHLLLAQAYQLSGERISNVEGGMSKLDSLINVANKLDNHYVHFLLRNLKLRDVLESGAFESGIDLGLKLRDEILKIEFEDKQKLNVLLASVNGNISVGHRKMANYPQALEHSILNEKYANKTKNPDLIYSSITKFIGIYGDLSSPEKAYGTPADRQKYKVLLEEFLLKSYNHSRGSGNKKSQAISAYNMSIYYALDSNLVAGLSFVDTAILVARAINNKDIITQAYSVKSDILSEMKNLDSAIIYQQKAFLGSKELGNSNLEIGNGMGLANLYIMDRQLNLAEQYLDEAFKLAQKENNAPKLKRGYHMFSELEGAKGNYKKALDYYIKYENLKDSIVTADANDEVNLITANYETELKQREIDQLKNEKELDSLKIKKQNNLLIFSILLGALISIFVFYYFKSSASMERANALNDKQKLLRSQLNPHFLFNALNSIQQFIYLEEDPKLIADYLAKFSRLTRRILINSKEDYISLGEEIDFLKDYMDLQKIRFDAQSMRSPGQWHATTDQKASE